MSEKKDWLIPEMESLVNQFTELLTGEVNEERVEMVKMWLFYNHIAKVMPNLVKHWNALEENQEARTRMREIFEQIKVWNEEHREQMRRQKEGES